MKQHDQEQKQEIRAAARTLSEALMQAAEAVYGHAIDA